MAATLVVDAILFDNDGTLIDSTPGVYAAWQSFGSAYGFDGTEAAHVTHGRRLVDSLAEKCRVDGLKLLEEVDRFEQLVLDVGPVILPGVKAVLDSINAGRSPERPGWVVVTSATGTYAPAALKRAGVPLPSDMVTSADVERGKPHPDPYLAGAAKCYADPRSCLVVEDAPSGIKSAQSAGCKTLAVCTSHTRDALEAFKPDFIVNDLTEVSVRWTGGKLEVSLHAI